MSAKATALPRKHDAVGSLCGGLSALWMLALPLAVAPWFHSEFTAPKALIQITLGMPLALFLLWRARRTATLCSLHVLVLTYCAALAVAASATHPDAAQWTAALFLLAGPLIAAHIGASSGGTALGLRALGRGLGVAAALVLLTGLIRRHTGALDWIPDRADVAFSATLGNSNEVAEFAAPIALLLLLLPGARWGDVALGLGALALTLLSESRAGLLAVVLGLVCGSLFLLRTTSCRRATILLALCGLGAATVLFLPTLEPLRARALSIFDAAHATNAVRLELYEATGRMIAADFPLGTGPGRFEAGIAPYRSAAEWHAAGPNSTVESPHNEFLFATAEAGVIGLVCALGLLAMLWLRWRRLRQTQPEAVGAVFAVFLAMLLFALTRSPLHHPCGSMAFGLVCGWLFAATPQPTTRTNGTLLITLLLGAALVGSAVHVSENLETGKARRALVGFDHYIRLKAPNQAMECVRECALHVENFAASPFSAEHSYRTALVARELAKLGHMFEDLGTPQDWLSGAEHAKDALIGHVREHRPLDLAARLLEAEELLRIDHTDLQPAAEQKAEALLRATLHELPNAPATRELLAELLLRTQRPGEALTVLRSALRMQSTRALQRHVGSLELLHGGRGTEALAWVHPQEPSEPPLLAAAREADLNQRGAEALDLALCVLAATPLHAEALDLVVRHGFAARNENDKLLANRATARAKLLLAVDAVAAGDAAALARNLRLALSRDPDLLPAHLLSVVDALQRGDSAAANAALSTLRSLGVEPARLREACADHAQIAPALAAGLLEPALR